MSKVAWVVNGVVDTVSMTRQPGNGWIACPDDTYADYLYDAQAEAFSPPPQSAPSESNVTAERDRRINAGTDITVTGIGAIPVSGRASVQADLTSLATAAQLASSTNPTATFPFRDEAGVTHNLTIAQTLELYSSGVAWVASVRVAAWALIDADPIPSDFASNSYWP